MHQHSADCNHAAIEPQAKQTHLLIAVLLIGSFAVAELLIGITSGSLALIAEAGHMASDSLALVLALLATQLAQQPQPSLLSDSFAGITGEAPEVTSKIAWETWAAFINGLVLVAIALWIGWEAIERLQHPPDAIASLPMLITAGIGLVVNSINIALLHHDSAHDLNLRGAFLHVLADAMSCIGVILAAIAVATLHWFWADGVISLIVAGMILLGATSLVVKSTQCLRAA